MYVSVTAELSADETALIRVSFILIQLYLINLSQLRTGPNVRVVVLSGRPWISSHACVHFGGGWVVCLLTRLSACTKAHMFYASLLSLRCVVGAKACMTAWS